MTGDWGEVAGRSARLLTLAAALVSGAGCTSEVRSDSRFGPPSLADPVVEVAVVERGRHTDIAIPADAMAEPVGAALRQAFPGARVLVFGFGDRAFYMAREETFAGMLAALFPGPGVVLVTGLRTSPAEAFGADHVVGLRLSASQADGLAAFIGRSLAIDGSGPPARLGDGPYPGSLFYASAQTYDVFYDCNRWTLSALQNAALPADPDGVIFAGQVMDQAGRIARQQRQAPAPQQRAK